MFPAWYLGRTKDGDLEVVREDEVPKGFKLLRSFTNLVDAVFALEMAQFEDIRVQDNNP